MDSQGTKSGIGVSRNFNSYEAGREAAQSALKELGAKQADLIILFTTDSFDQEKVLSGVRSVTGQAPLIGCCSGGILVPEGIIDDGLAVAAIKSDELLFFPVSVDNVSQDPLRSGKELGEKIISAFKSSGREEAFGCQTVVSLLNGFSKTNISEMIRGAYSVLGANYRFVGGGSGDSLKFKKTYQFLNGQVFSDAFIGLLVVSKSPQGISLGHGWEPVGNLMIVTKAEGKTILEIDNKPALDVYMGLRGVAVEDFDYSKFYQFAMNYPLGMPLSHGEYVIRDPFSASLDDRSMTFVSEVPENSVIQLMQGDNQSVLAASQQAAADISDQMPGKPPSFFMIFDCVSRTILLGDDMLKELQDIRSILGTDVPFIGCLVFGEIGVKKGGMPVFGNKTCAIHVL